MGSRGDIHTYTYISQIETVRDDIAPSIRMRGKQSGVDSSQNQWGFRIILLLLNINNYKSFSFDTNRQNITLQRLSY